MPMKDGSCATSLGCGREAGMATRGSAARMGLKVYTDIVRGPDGNST